MLIDKTTEAEMVLYDILGKEVRQLFVGQMRPGVHSMRFGIGDLSSGRYFIRFATTLTQKVVPIDVMR